MKKLVLCMTVLASSFSLAAGIAPQSRDGRIQYVSYDKDGIVSVRGSVGVATQIVFEEGEEVLDAASGFTDGWEVSDRGNNLYMKPKQAAASTNLIVTTNRRTYAFDLRYAGKNIRPTYRLTFRYPEVEKAAGKAAVDRQLVTGMLNRPTSEQEKNKKYVVKPNKYAEEITPTEVFDDGRFTYIKFPKNGEMPVIYKVDSSKQENLVNTHVADDYLVVQGIYRDLILRSGKAVVTLKNNTYSGGGSDVTGTGTVSPGVSRVVVNGGL